MFAFAYVIPRSDVQPKWLLDFQFQSFPWPWQWTHYLSSSSDVRDGGLLLVCDFFIQSTHTGILFLPTIEPAPTATSLQRLLFFAPVDSP